MSFKKIISVILSACVMMSIVTLSGCSEEQEEQLLFYKVNKDNLLFSADENSYFHYLDINKDVAYAKEDIVLDTKAIANAASGEYPIMLDGNSYALIDENSKWVEWKIDVPENAFYTLWTDYRTIEGSGVDIEVAVMVDGEYPYEDLSNLKLSRRWTDISGESFDIDSEGNDIRPAKKEVFVDLSTGFMDDKGYYADPYRIALTKGLHTIRLLNVREGVLIKSLSLLKREETPTYQEYIADKKLENTDADVIVIEAEHPAHTNTSGIYAVSDPQDVATTPNSPKVTKLNAVGDSNWNRNGQTISWDFYVEKSGFYYINARARQDYAEGMSGYRSVYIDGSLPFKEAGSMQFKYNFEWQSVTLGGEQPYMIYLDKGEHTISMSVNPGNISEVLLDLNTLVLDLNMIYRKIIVITGIEVDIYQDYSLDTKIPELIDSLKDCRNRMLNILNKIEKSTGSKGSQASVLAEAAALIETFVDHPYEISGGLSSFKSNVDSIASLLTTMSSQALLLDKINIVPAGKEAPEVNTGFFTKLKFSISKFIDSYIPEETPENNGKKINVWVSTGRDQAQIIKQMIDNQFSNALDTQVQLSIVDTGSTLLQAALADKGPDVALGIGHDTPVNLAMRGGLLDLTEFDLKSIYDNYYESAWEQLKYGDGIYGVPETQTFEMLFVRDDILEELGLAVPETWEELYGALEKIQGNNLMVGIAETGAAVTVSGGISTFSKLYFQQGGTYYNDDFSATTFDSELAVSCLTEVCELYTKYGLDRQFDFFNRFRSGEMAMGIAGYSTYNQLVAAAPEISGLWSMHPIPGTLTEDGSINRAQNSSGTASIILKAAKERGVANEAWEFVKWWNSTEAQSEYAERLEGIMGTAARYTPANKAAFDTIRWTEEEAEVLKAQWLEVYNVREIPGNYYISRALTSAIRNTINKGTSIRFNITKYNNDINSEITRKREEFGLN